MLRFHGIPFIDLANLRKVDLRNGYLTIRRHKTGMPLSITVDAAAMKLLRRYANNDPSSPYLLNILNAVFPVKKRTRIISGHCVCSIYNCTGSRGSAGWGRGSLPTLPVILGPLLQNLAE